MKKNKLAICALFLLLLVLNPHKIFSQIFEVPFGDDLKFSGLVPLEQNNNLVGYVAFFNRKEKDKLYTEFIAFNKNMEVFKRGNYDEKLFDFIERKNNHAVLIGDSICIISAIGPQSSDKIVNSNLLIVPVTASFGMVGALIYMSFQEHTINEKLQFVRYINLKEDADTSHIKRWHVNSKNILSNKLSMTRDELRDRNTIFNLYPLNQGLLAIEHPLKKKNKNNTKLLFYDKKNQIQWIDSLPLYDDKKINEPMRLENTTVYQDQIMVHRSLYKDGYLEGNTLYFTNLDNSVKSKKYYNIDDGLGYNEMHFVKNNKNTSKLLMVAKRHKGNDHRKTQGIYLAYFDSLQNNTQFKNILFKDLEQNQLYKYLQDNDRWLINKVCWDMGKIIIVMQKESDYVGYTDLLCIIMNEDFSNVDIKLNSNNGSSSPVVVGDIYKTGDKLGLNLYDKKFSLDFHQLFIIEDKPQILKYDKKVPFGYDFSIEGMQSIIFGEVDKKSNKLILKSIGI